MRTRQGGDSMDQTPNTAQETEQVKRLVMTKERTWHLAQTASWELHLDMVLDGNARENTGYCIMV